MTTTSPLLKLTACALIVLCLPACAPLSAGQSQTLQAEQLPQPVVDMPRQPSEILQSLKTMQNDWDMKRRERLLLLTPSEAPTKR